jgi:hypothetical protein
MENSDTRLEEWIEEFGQVTSYSFMVFDYFGLRDNAIINQGLTMFLNSQGYDKCRYMQIVEEVDLELASVFGTKPGLNIQWIFPDNKSEDFDDIVITTIEDGMIHLQKDFEFYGRFGNVD